ncbi:MOSC domain-containing protein [Cavenderia fasciculata]|uniref:MOSC domain-containing protein n=1 Tax=Cavenderia fasciculata TaxID=261658 RepID=F4QEG7_CACFS|nr:MOSC domain-containing protein [Cavenderia fasciculata]EGG13280.1 MOSC domain-containing protein [Cavenderia fasciculata]|eukprot:XP_004349979.1 MOSC domain-containing protein [Cavenderia fasciculata]
MSVVAVSQSKEHHFSKDVVDSITLIEGRGVLGDCHFGENVQHLSRVKVNPNQPNLRQVHLISQEFQQELKGKGFVKGCLPGQMGENITTVGIDLINLPLGTTLTINDVVLEITGLRNPCPQLSKLESDLLEACRLRDEQGEIIVRKSGIMAIVLKGGSIKASDKIIVQSPPEPHVALKVV